MVALFVALSAPALAANTISSTDIIDGQVKTPDLALDAVVSNRIANGQVKAGDLATDAVRSAKIANGHVRAPDIATNEVGFDEVSPSAFAAGDIAPNPAGTKFEIPSEAIQAEEISPQETFLLSDITDIGPGGRYNVADAAIDSGEIQDGIVRAPDLGLIWPVVATVPISGNSWGAASAQCPRDPDPESSWRVIGGGAQLLGGGYLAESLMRINNNDWYAAARHFGSGTGNLKVFAHCLVGSN